MSKQKRRHDADGKSLWPTKAEAAEEKANAAEMEIERLRALLKKRK
ncbi:MAG: hypothetical protein AAFN74_16980 [Myxococcota bacterium]